MVDELTPEDTESVVIPDIPFLQQVNIGKSALRLYKLRDEANVLEDEAIAELEAVISG